MTAFELLQMLGYVFNILGLLICIGGLTLARRPEQRVLGRGLAVLGFVIAATPCCCSCSGWSSRSPRGRYRRASPTAPPRAFHRRVPCQGPSRPAH